MNIENKISVTTVPAVINANFDELKAALTAELKKYEITVTEDTIAGAKKLCADLNKSKSHIANVRKERAAEASEPVRLFEEQMREFELEVASAVQKIRSQIQYFEEDRKLLLRGLLLDYRLEQWQNLGVRDEFQAAEIDDLVMVSNITKSGSISKAARDAVDARIQGQLSVQSRTDRRLLELENKCLRAGIRSPLRREHVEQFLFAEDAEYESMLSQLIQVEIERVCESRPSEALKETETATVEIVQPAVMAGKNDVEAGKKRLRVLCEFCVDVPHSVSSASIESAYRKKLIEAGFKSVDSVSVLAADLRSGDNNEK